MGLPGESACLEMSDLNSRVHSSRIEMAPHPIETIFGAEQLRITRWTVVRDFRLQRQAPVRDFSPHHATHFLRTWEFVLFAAVQQPSNTVLKDPSPPVVMHSSERLMVWLPPR
ncbi:hypothetical protein TNCV_2088211 [Trichonephila clavipes]|nr:hypothetical protein TNCV_2088211 [Trichonephila clavipes]